MEFQQKGPEAPDIVNSVTKNICYKLVFSFVCVCSRKNIKIINWKFKYWTLWLQMWANFVYAFVCLFVCVCSLVHLLLSVKFYAWLVNMLWRKREIYKLHIFLKSQSLVCTDDDRIRNWCNVLGTKTLK